VLATATDRAARKGPAGPDGPGAPVPPGDAPASAVPGGSGA
jgi:hypothetical protein